MSPLLQVSFGQRLETHRLAMYLFVDPSCALIWQVAQVGGQSLSVRIGESADWAADRACMPRPMSCQLHTCCPRTVYASCSSQPACMDANICLSINSIASNAGAASGSGEHVSPLLA